VNDKKDHIIDSRKQDKEIDLWGQLQMAKLFTKVLKAKRLSWRFTLFAPISWIGYEFGWIQFEFGFRLYLNWIEFHNQFQLVWIWKFKYGLELDNGFDIWLGLELDWNWFGVGTWLHMDLNIHMSTTTARKEESMVVGLEECNWRTCKPKLFVLSLLCSLHLKALGLDLYTWSLLIPMRSLKTKVNLKTINVTTWATHYDCQ
jgi:hypothetical protein